MSWVSVHLPTTLDPDDVDPTTMRLLSSGEQYFPGSGEVVVEAPHLVPVTLSGGLFISGDEQAPLGLSLDGQYRVGVGQADWEPVLAIIRADASPIGAVLIGKIGDQLRVYRITTGKPAPSPPVPRERFQPKLRTEENRFVAELFTSEGLNVHLLVDVEMQPCGYIFEACFVGMHWRYRVKPQDAAVPLAEAFPAFEEAMDMGAGILPLRVIRDGKVLGHVTSVEIGALEGVDLILDGPPPD
jgi:hypothetical protein